jgi:hypothetical protein
LCAHGFASPDRAVDTAGNDILCQIKESSGFFAIHGFIVLSLFERFYLTAEQSRDLQLS